VSHLFHGFDTRPLPYGCDPEIDEPNPKTSPWRPTNCPMKHNRPRAWHRHLAGEKSSDKPASHLLNGQLGSLHQFNDRTDKKKPEKKDRTNNRTKHDFAPWNAPRCRTSRFRK